MSEQPFWRRKRLEEMSREEWESLCDGCAKCCLVKLQDEDSGEIRTTDVVCRLLDKTACRCRAYNRRSRLVPNCVTLSPGKLAGLPWMPATCAYRLLFEGRDLPSWHPLVTGDSESVHRAGISVRGRVVSELEVSVDDLEDRIVDWPDEERVE